MGAAKEHLCFHELDEEVLQRRTQFAFEVQRFIQSGVEPSEASRLCVAGEVLPPGGRAVPRPAAAAAAVAAATPPPTAEEKDNKIEEVINFSGCTHDAALDFLRQADWSIEMAI